ncbi:alginate lyase family protein [Ideonella sp. A 288]|uniref:alginate lyase family protein n=1 Tax=Ideonella sp. A 288 TaxID=1962181 RepID=UPI000B4B9F79|nr:alginate lyase family protein [Ideonella sp. A 288]
MSLEGSSGFADLQAIGGANAGPDALFDAPWCGLDDAGLLAHFRSARGVRFEPVVDPEEVLAERIAGIMQGRFEFNGETHALTDPIDWLTNPSRDVEWHILLHKFYYAAGLSQAWHATGDVAYVRRWAQLIDGWMRVTPVGFIAADVTGRRVQNWIYSLHGMVMNDRPDAQSPVDAGFFRRMLHSLHAQVEFICANLTPKRNHRTLELLAVGLAGVVFPEFRRAAHWREFALAETLVNVRADLMADGVHCELSTDYHHLAVRNWLQVRTLAARNGVPVPLALDEALEQALEFSLHVHQPSGIAPSFSDGDARSYLPLLRQGAQLFGRDDMLFVATQGREGHAPSARTAHFDASGYHVLRSDWSPAPAFTDAQHLVFDCGPLGEGNHGHFDALSFELAAFGRALVVDPGRYTYSEAGETNWRVHFRGTAAHNTVCVDGRHQTRYAPKAIKEASRHAHGSVRHKIGGPAPQTDLIERVDGACLDLLHGRCASHEYDAVHERCIVFVDRRYWIVSDWLRAASDHDYALRFQLGPEAEGHAVLSGTGCTLLTSPGLAAAQARRAGQSTTLDAGWVSMRYGHKHPAPAWVTRAHGRDVEFDTVLLPCRDAAPMLQMDELAVTGAAGHTGRALLLRLALDDGGVVEDGWFHAHGADAGSDAGTWQIGPLEFTGRWLHWRETPTGQVLRAVSHPGARLRSAAGEIDLTVAGAS